MSDKGKGTKKTGPVRRSLRSILYASVGVVSLSGGYLRDLYGRSVKQGEETVSHAQAAAKQRIPGQKGSTVEQNVGEAVDSIQKTVDQTTTQDRVDEAMQKVADAGQKAADSVEETVGDVSQQMTDVGQKTVDTVKSAVDDASETMVNATEDASDRLATATKH